MRSRRRLHGRSALRGELLRTLARPSLFRLIFAENNAGKSPPASRRCYTLIGTPGFGRVRRNQILCGPDANPGGAWPCLEGQERYRGAAIHSVRGGQSPRPAREPAQAMARESQACLGAQTPCFAFGELLLVILRTRRVTPHQRRALLYVKEGSSNATHRIWGARIPIGHQR